MMDIMDRSSNSILYVEIIMGKVVVIDTVSLGIIINLYWNNLILEIINSISCCFIPQLLYNNDINTL